MLECQEFLKMTGPEYIGAFSMKFMENCIEKHLGLLVQSVYKLLNLG